MNFEGWSAEIPPRSDPFSSADSTPGAEPGAIAPTAPAPAREPAWRGVDIVIFLLFAAVVGLVALIAGGLATGLVTGANAYAGNNITTAAMLLLVTQTVALAAGFALAAWWIPHHSGMRFWRAIHWRRLPVASLVAIFLSGPLVAIGLQIVAQHLPSPGPVPEDRLFSTATIWPVTIYGVLVAPFFEEFYFRGLIYPSLRASFADGLSAEDRAAWQPFVRLLAALAALTCGYTWLRIAYGQVSVAPHVPAVVLAVGAVALFLVAFPQPLLALAAVLFGQSAHLQRPELLAVILTGVLFGLVHSSQLGGAWGPVALLVVVGIVLTAIRARTGSLAASWAFHVAYNGALFALMFHSTQGYHDFQKLLH